MVSDATKMALPMAVKKIHSLARFAESQLAKVEPKMSFHPSPPRDEKMKKNMPEQSASRKRKRRIMIKPMKMKEHILKMVAMMSNSPFRHPFALLRVLGAEANSPALRAFSMILLLRFSILTGKPCMRRRSSGVLSSGTTIHRMR